MKTRTFSFNLPEELIAQSPAAERGASRLLVLDRASGTVRHDWFSSLPDLLSPETLIVFNDTSVVKARIYGRSADGLSAAREMEVLLVERVSALRWKILARGKRKSLSGKYVVFPEGLAGTIDAGEPEGTGGGAFSAGDEYLYIDFDKPLSEDYLERNGHVPLPPYIRRPDNEEDLKRYETVYASVKGSVAAPTAGLHFSEAMLGELTKRGIEYCFVTLHVGLGTFRPIRAENIEDHVMHEEEYFVSDETAAAVTAAHRAGRHVCAVGTTVVRTLESAWKGTLLQAGRGRTGLFITPGYSFGIVKQLVTNFHTPESSLLVLVSAFAGVDSIRQAYEEAVREKYRFFSYGDAMFIQ
ncbi:MAG: tRNA preQ1(34) S-adenosylmethionine ribosyltransferase-isomerase QueA [Spirochaetales bacterium]|nr:MAG: tRNA preQ1(34) S-adenosylmethionine ribosyltransferase-isomerase QueA [Spirochaetales bacterium]